MNFGSEYTYLSSRKLKYSPEPNEPAHPTDLQSDRPLHAPVPIHYEEQKHPQNQYQSDDEIDPDQLLKFIPQHLQDEIQQYSQPSQQFNLIKMEVDSNIIQIPLIQLQEGDSIIQTGEPFSCILCGAVFNAFSNINSNKIWNCEFCGFPNKIDLDDEEIPKKNCMTYVMSNLVEESKVTESELRLIFCLDISESMNNSIATEAVLPKYQSNKAQVTRLECVQIAIDKEIEELSKSAPNLKVGLVAFSDIITLIGDGTLPPLKLPTKLNYDSNGITNFMSYKSHILTQPISESKFFFLEKLKAIKPSGMTAMGPALLSSLQLASSGKKGSKVVICTDGISNVGIGAVETEDKEILEESEKFYDEIAEWAKSKGIMVSIISVVQEECKLQMLSPIANKTGGRILKVDPKKLHEELEAFISEKIVATDVEVKLQIHKGLEFRNQKKKYQTHDNTILTLPVGNVTPSTNVSVEYALKTPGQLKYMDDLNYLSRQFLPFQARIAFTNEDNNKCLKVITKLQKVTHEKDQAKLNVNDQVIHSHALKTTAQISQKGKYLDAQANAFHYSKWVKQGAQNNYIQMISPMYTAIQIQTTIQPKEESKEPPSLPLEPNKKSKRFERASKTIDSLSAQINRGLRGNVQEYIRRTFKK